MKINFNKMNGLVPAIVQDAATNKVLMLGFMNEEAYQKTLEIKKVTFFSRSRNTLWTKGETSGNFLNLVAISADCDSDTLLIKVNPTGPVCHTGKDTCFDEINKNGLAFLGQLDNLIAERKQKMPENSYTTKLFKDGIKKISQKVGEEATEVVIDAMAKDKPRLLEESADLIYHLLVMLNYFDLKFEDVVGVLELRHK
ncbi:MAG: bifunctional phosphoribosyl-AMP cyclohydrolase/phosphoribosyl-ATP diphosphatase HisIE [Calditrichaceae bacterium]|nr:bifunctional phosphoribosyl-AMP cyclohydrolase/phosphoribosyl-ATP diphosphatase HisIE [Calditrichaceae bacterium]